MIVTVTLNPALDKTAKVQKLLPRGLNRLEGVQIDAGGKGVNVSAMIRALGGKSLAVGFAGGGAGEELLRLISLKGLDADFVKVKASTRTNLKVMDAEGNLTELNEPGPQISPSEWDEMEKKLLSLASQGVYFSLSGSLPGGILKGAYQKLTVLLKKKGARIFLDADGEALKLALQNPGDSLPDYLKPNKFELLEYFGITSDAPDSELIRLSQSLIEKGVGLVAVSKGGEGALFISGRGAWGAPALKVKISSTVGAGDSMIGALLFGMEKGLPEEELWRLALAAGAGACVTPGTNPPEKGLVEELMAQSIVTKIS